MTAASGSSVAGDDIFKAIERLGDLKAKGLLSDEEFTAKKSELLGRLISHLAGIPQVSREKTADRWSATVASRVLRLLFTCLEAASAERELNPHIRHGKAIGCRYIMGTFHRCRIAKETESTGWGSNPRCRLTRAESCRLDHQCVSAMGPEGLNPHPPG